MKVRLFACLVCLTAAPVAFAADEENPFKKVKVGDFATYKVTAKGGGAAGDGTLTQTVTAKSDKEATIKATMKLNGRDLPAQEQKIDLTKPYDPTKAVLPAGIEGKVEKLKDGTEKVKVAGKEYDTKWEAYKMVGKAGGVEFIIEAKAWMAKDLPLQVVKMEMTTEVMGMKGEMVMELTESGSKSD